MRALRRAAGWLVALAAIAVAALILYAFARSRPQDLPWPPLDLGQPVGAFTARKLIALTDDAPSCRALMTRAGARFTALPPRRDGAQCGYDDAVRPLTGGARSIAWRPAGLGVSCAVAAGLAMWEWQVVQPAAERHLGTRVTAIDHFGSYSCRRLYGRSEGGWSEHSTADAVDVAGFRFADSQRVTVVGDWRDGDARAAFLREVRDGACRLFGTTLSPDYNAAHRDHLHLDMAKRAGIGGGYCR